MGLDSQLISVHETELAYWRKNYDLHQFFEGLWLRSDDKENVIFNHVNFYLSEDELNEWEKAVNYGYFEPQDNEDMLRIIDLARSELASGRMVCYYSSW